MRVITVFCLVLFNACNLASCDQGRIAEAFSELDAGMRRNLVVLERQNLQLYQQIESRLSTNLMAETQRELPALEQARTQERALQEFIDQLRAELLAGLAGVPAPKLDERHSKAVKEVLLAGSPNRIEMLDTRVNQLRSTMMAVHPAHKSLSAPLPLRFSAQPDGRYKLLEEKGNFRDLPLSGVLCVLSGLQVSARASLALVLDDFLMRTHPDGTLCRWEMYWPMVLPKAAYITSGETFEADIFLAARQDEVNLLGVSVNGAPLPVRDGQTRYWAEAENLGRKNLVVEMLLSRIRRKGDRYQLDSFRVKRECSYHVGTFRPRIEFSGRSAFLYAGLENPITLSAWDGFAGNDFRRKAVGATLTSEASGGAYTLRPHNLRPVTLWLRDVAFRYSVRPLPDPVPLLPGVSASSFISLPALAAATELQIKFPEDLEIDATCSILSFTVNRFRPREDVEEMKNEGAGFNANVLELLRTSRHGDRLVYDEIEIQCPGDAKPRMIGGLSLRVD